MVYKILGGPSKLDLMNSLFEGKIVHFTVQYGYAESKTTKVKVVVSAVCEEDGSHDKWLLRLVVKESDISYFERLKTLSAFYNSRGRIGHLKLQ